MRRPSLPQPAQPARQQRPDAIAAGVLAFLSTVYVLANRDPLTATLITATLWSVGILLYSTLSRGRWRLVAAYFRERHLLMRRLGQAEVGARSEVLDAKGASISARERAEFTKLMEASGFSDRWPEA